MFTGLVTDLGRVKEIDRRGGGVRLCIGTAYDMAEIDIGASIACCGACLTAVEKGPDWFAADVSEETLSRTTLGDWRAGSQINLERSLRLGDAMGGHLVTGHVDAAAQILERRPDGDSERYVVAIPDDYASYVASKGSVALDGVSLTVNEVADNRFGVNIVPHTADNTTFGTLQPGDRVNFEVDLIARYVARLLPQK